jgi:hypothetical protein
LLQLLTFPLELTSEAPSGSVMPRRSLLGRLRGTPTPPVAIPINEPLLPSHLTPILDGFAEPGARSFLLNWTREGDPNYFFSDAFADAWRPAVRRLILVRLQGQAELAAQQHSLQGSPVVVKEPNGSHGAEMVMSLLPRSRMIVQLRDGRDVIDSLVHAQSSGGWLSGPDAPWRAEAEAERLGFVRHQANLWVNRAMAVQRAHDAHPAELRWTIRYEELRADPVGTVRPLFEWLGVERSQRDLERTVSALSFESYPAEAKGPTKALRAATPGLWRENMTGPEQEVMAEIMGETLERLGYGV